MKKQLWKVISTVLAAIMMLSVVSVTAFAEPAPVIEIEETAAAAEEVPAQEETAATEEAPAQEEIAAAEEVPAQEETAAATQEETAAATEEAPAQAETAAAEEQEEEPVTISVPEEVVESIDAPADAAGFAVYELGDAVSFHTPIQKAALLDDIENIKAYGEGLEENSRPQGAVLRWTYEGEAPESFTITLSEQPDLSDAILYSAEAAADENGIYSYAVKNLYLRRTYYYTIAADGTENVSDVHSFTSANDLPRNLEVDGVTNVRDMGGWPLADGGYERQGMIFRGAKFNQNESEEVLVTEEGIKTLVEELGIKTELDFRTVDDNENGGITTSPLGESVRYCSMPWSATSIAKAADMIRDIMVLFSEEENYPIYYHCSIGTDRTGFIAVLIHGLLGVSEEDIYRDYVFSDLGVIETAREAKNMRNRVEKNIKVCEGETLQEQVRNYLLSIGVTEEQMDQIVAIMTEQ